MKYIIANRSSILTFRTCFRGYIIIKGVQFIRIKICCVTFFAIILFPDYSKYIYALIKFFWLNFLRMWYCKMFSCEIFLINYLLPCQVTLIDYI
jgi:hypothetical protein